MRWHGVLAALFAVPVLAQTVRLENHSGVAFAGYVRTTVDREPPFMSGAIKGARYTMGRRVGLDTRVVDVFVSLAAGESKALDLSEAAKTQWTPSPLPVDPVAHFGGAATVNGQPMQWVGLQEDGAGWTAHLRCRTGRMFAVDLWLTYYPLQPSWCRGEAIVTASNSTVPDITATTTEPLVLRFGDAVPMVTGGSNNGTLIPTGVTFGDGQARAFPLTFVWLRHLRDAATWSTVGAAVSHVVCAAGVEKLLADGNPTYPPNYNVLAWVKQKLPGAVSALHSWNPSTIGPNPQSGDTGRQWDQAFVCGEPLLPGGVSAVTLIYFAGLNMGKRPCDHREPDGSPLDPAKHLNPRLVLWDSRPHWNANVSPDRLGKLGGLTVAQANNWWGADVEHWLHNTTAAAARYTGSPAVQHILSQQARIYPLQWTTTAGWSNSSPFAARATGWEGIMAVHLWRELEDRDLAARTVAHWRERVTKVIIPAHINKWGDWWDPRKDDPRLGPGDRVMPWQQAVGCYGLDLACAQVGPPEGRALALRAAKAVLRDAYVWTGTRWTTRDLVCFDGFETTRGYYDFFGDPLAAAVVLRHEPTHAQARAIWTQFTNEAKALDQLCWVAPGVPQ